MQLLVVFVSLAATCVLGATDPTKICLPEIFEGDVTFARKHDFGKLAVDFKKGLLAVTFLKAELRVVVNLTDIEGYAINIKDGSCNKILVGAHIPNIVSRCWPEYWVELPSVTVKLLTNGPSTTSVAPNSVSTGGVEIAVGNGVTKIALPTGKDPVPVIRTFGSGGTNYVSIYGNVFSISDYKIFDVPDDCKSTTVVG